MSVIGSNILAGASGQGGDYTIARSLRFRSSASAYLNRTQATPTSTTIWTWSSWVKRGSLSTAQQLFAGGTVASNDAAIYFETDNTLIVSKRGGFTIGTTAVYRDPSAWYHIVVAYDSTQGTSSNRLKVYVNGTQVTALNYSTYPTSSETSSLNASGIAQYIGKRSDGYYFDGYYAENNFIDGQALTPSSFGANSEKTGVWQPKKYAGTYGTNGFYLPFTDNASTTTLGADFSGNGNNWTTNNISLTAGSTYDSMTDVPTLTSATASNFAVLNPLANGGGTLSAGNLNLVGASSAWGTRLSTIAISSGKWYCEVTPTSGSSTQGIIFGVSNYITPATNFIGFASTSYGYYGADGSLYSNGSNTSGWGSTVSDNDIVGIALDLDNGTLKFYKNNVQQGSTITGLSGQFYIGVSCYGTATASINFGQRPFAYTPPTGFVALNTFNLPTPTIGATASTQANKYMDVSLYSGNASTQVITNSSSMQPDFVWIKERSSTSSHVLSDSVRGAGNILSSNTTDAESTGQVALTSFNSNGFTVGDDGKTNESGQTYVGWQWRASNATAVSNTAGSITSTVSANTSAGFSVVTYTGTGANATVGHGLGVAPSMYIVKRRNAGGDNWAVYNANIGNTQFLRLDTTNAAQTFNLWQNTTPTSSVFYLTSDVGVNGSGSTYVAYCFSEVAGYSKFGSYTGNGSTDGTFVYTGFRPKFIMIKKVSGGTGEWVMIDTSRSPYNLVNLRLAANDSAAEQTFNICDILSNGFKFRNGDGIWNDANPFIYAAFAEYPFKYSLAR